MKIPREVLFIGGPILLWGIMMVLLVFAKSHREAEINNAKTLVAKYHDWGSVTKVGPCRSGKYSYKCRVYTLKMEIYVDLDDLPFDTISVGDRLGSQELITDQQYKHELCHNSMCTSSVQYEICDVGSSCYDKALKRLAGGVL